MNKKWQLLPLCNVATITMGLSPEGSTYNNDGIGVPLLNGPTEFGPINPECTIFTTDSKRECLPGDLIFCVRGSTTGRMNWADQVYSLGRGVCAISGETIAETKYIKYCLDIFLPALLKVAGGSTMPNLNKDDIADFKIPYSQDSKEIAAILSTYDDLIENNTRRISLLEKMAEEVYREWFVRLRFPGHAQVPVHQGVPEGWERKDLGSVCELNARSIDSNNCPSMIDYIDISSVGTRKILKTEPFLISEAPGRARRIVQHGDIIWSSVRPENRAYCLMLNPSPKLVVSTGFVVISSKGDIPYTYIYAVVTDSPFVDHLTNVAKGAAYPAVSKDDFAETNILIPSPGVLANYDECCKPIWSQVSVLHIQNSKLRSTRDRLLSRLLSGRLDVENLDIQFPPGMREMGQMHARP